VQALGVLLEPRIHSSRHLQRFVEFCPHLFHLGLRRGRQLSGLLDLSGTLSGSN